MKLLGPNLLRMLGLCAIQGDLGPLTLYTSRRNHLVFYARSPPRTPPTPRQISRRNLLRIIGTAWKLLTPEQRAAWEQITLAARLRITGYNLWTYYCLTKDLAAIQTLTRLTGIDPFATD